MSDDTAGKKIEAGNPRDAFTAEHQRKAWEIAAECVRIAHFELRGAITDFAKVDGALRCARLAQQIATGAL